MRYTDNEMCTILLSSYIGIKEESTMKPLTLREWYKLVDVLVENKLEPSIVFDDNIAVLKEFGYDDTFLERIKSLVDRGVEVALELDEYAKRGISVTTFLSKDYPILLRLELKNKRPPVLFYAGDISLANKAGIGVVGSRNISDQGVQFIKQLVEKAVKEKLVVYSGGAKGADMTSQTVALNRGGAVVVYIADALIDKMKKEDIAKYIAEGKLLLISDLKPDAGFSAGRALNRNKYIYASAQGTFVVESEYNKGGTWTGAVEAIKNKWGKVFVWDNKSLGNTKMIELGGCPFEITEEMLMDVISKKQNSGVETEYQQLSLEDVLFTRVP